MLVLKYVSFLNLPLHLQPYLSPFNVLVCVCGGGAGGRMGGGGEKLYLLILALVKSRRPPHPVPNSIQLVGAQWIRHPVSFPGSF